MIDFNYSPGTPVLTTDVDLVLQQIDMIFETTPREVLDDETYGSEYDKYLYKLKVSNEGIKYKVLSDLNKLDLQGFTPGVEVYILKGTERDIIMIDISLTKNYTTYNKTYKIS